MLFLDDVEDSRSQFYHQSYGFSIMDQYFENPPRVFLFSNMSVKSLETTSQWTIPILNQKQDHASDYHTELAHLESRLEEQSDKLLEAEQQKKSHIDRWYPGNDFDQAFVAIVATCHHEENRNLVSPGSGVNYAQSNIKLSVCQKETYPDPSLIKMPATIAELINMRPYEYGLRREDDFPHADTAYPMGLIHQPISFIYDPSRTDLSRFNGAANTPTSPTLNASDEPKYYKALIEIDLRFSVTSSGAINHMLEVIGLNGEPHGLLELRTLKIQGRRAGFQFFSGKSTAKYTSALINGYTKFGKPLQISRRSSRT
jgi:hypothetical protein